MIRSEKRLRLCGWLTACILIFIWGNSLLPGEVSMVFSDWVKALLSALFPGDGIGTGQGSGLLRKIAHFTEFAALGVTLGWLFGMLGRKPYVPFLCGMAAAFVDEAIQLFVPARSAALWDVAIDSSGVLTGLILLYLGHHYFKRKNKNHFGG